MAAILIPARMLRSASPRMRVRKYKVVADFTPDLEPVPLRRPIRLFRPYGWARDRLGRKSKVLAPAFVVGFRHTAPA
jgi:hypothetical protein